MSDLYYDVYLVYVGRVSAVFLVYKYSINTLEFILSPLPYERMRRNLANSLLQLSLSGKSAFRFNIFINK